MGGVLGFEGNIRVWARMLFRGMLLAASLQAFAAPALAAGEAAAVPAAKPAAIEGFRSAAFGMNKKAVQGAIQADFKVDAKKILQAKSPTERTESLTITVPDVLPEGGTATVSYVLGYTTKALIQVGVSWSKASDPKMDVATLQANGEILRNHFLSEGFDPATVKSGLVVDSGVVLFQAADTSGHTVLLLLQGSFKNDEAGKSQLEPEALVLLYVKSIDEPDIFKVAKGKF